MLKAIIFDFDFTLADSSKGVYQCINYALKKLSYPAFSIKETNKTIGLSLEDTFENLTGSKELELKNQFKKLFIECADKKMAKNTYIYRTVPKTIKMLKENNIKLGIVSTKFRYRINDILKRYKINKYFDLIIGGEDVTNNKPNPEGINKFIKILELKKDECVLIGDSLIDAETAKNSEISFIPILTGTTKKEDFKSYDSLLYLNEIYDIVKYNIWN
jgi:phosphoglycolate phosphatase